MAEEKRSSISAVVITTNNEATIKRCLESVKWADEIVVVDAFSSDRTVEITKGYTDKLWQRPWPGFAGQWNFAIEKAVCSWIFILASDECVSGGLKEEMRQIAGSADSANGYYVPRKTYFLGKWIRHCGWYPDYSIRLFKKGSGRFDNRIVHERVVVRGKTSYLKNAIDHFSFPTVSGYIERLNHYTSLEAQEMAGAAANIDINRTAVKATAKAVKTFWKMYIRQAGFKDGMRGLFLSFFSSLYQFMVYAKYWEIAGSRYEGQQV